MQSDETRESKRGSSIPIHLKGTPGSINDFLCVRLIPFGTCEGFG